jgi:macrolide transport system ATP-binding/permease protein
MSDPSAPPLIELRDIRKVYDTGGVAVEVLCGVTLTIRAGEFVAIMGASGSGKSTLMNLLGLLDRPTSGLYRFAGRDVTHLDHDERAALRRHAFGFVFQQYNLIPSATALENVEMPAMYAGMPADARRARARSLLERLGLGERLGHRPSQLSGGQQQRVSIARALMNGGFVVLADEPTGALDSRTSAEVMTLLSELAAEGHTVILITHDRDVAAAADRIVEIADGAIVSDTARPDRPRSPLAEGDAGDSGASVMADMGEALRQARRGLAANPIRTALTLTGIIIGVASVIALMAIGEGTKQSVLEQITAYGTNRLYVNPGNATGRGPGGTLSVADVEIVRGVANVTAAMPYLEKQVTVRHGNIDARTNATAVTTDYPRILNWPVVEGSFFTDADERGLATVAVIGKKVRDALFPDGADPLRKFILVNDIPFQVVGVLDEKGTLTGSANADNTIAIPFTTGSQRLFGTPYLTFMSVLIDDFGKAGETVEDITATLAAAHRVEDFTVYNRAASIASRMKTQSSLTLQLGFTAAISLLVGGIGVMNMMLMTVAERTREIGIRMAMGARAGDILRQFLAEALMLAVVGGLIGFLIGHLTGFVAATFGTRVIFTAQAAATALLCSVVTGLVFGFMPARRAARLDPVVALARE